MPRSTERLLDVGERFPEMELHTVGGAESARLPQFAEGGWGILLIYRGHW